MNDTPVHPTDGARLAYDACVAELIKAGRTADEANARAAELMKKWVK